MGERAEALIVKTAVRRLARWISTLPFPGLRVAAALQARPIGECRRLPRSSIDGAPDTGGIRKAGLAKLTVIGAGMMGSALCVPLADRGHDVRLVGSPLDDVLERSLGAGQLGGLTRHELPLLARLLELGLHDARFDLQLAELFTA
jgi:hypothetical protein